MLCYEVKYARVHQDIIYLRFLHCRFVRTDSAEYISISSANHFDCNLAKTMFYGQIAQIHSKQFMQFR